MISRHVALTLPISNVGDEMGVLLSTCEAPAAYGASRIGRQGIVWKGICALSDYLTMEIST